MWRDVAIYTDIPAADIAFALKRIGVSVIRNQDRIIARMPRHDGVADIVEDPDVVNELPVFLRLQAG